MNVETKALENSSPNGSSARRALSRLRALKTNETEEWIASLEYVVEHILRTQGQDRAEDFIEQLIDRLRASGVQVPPTVSTPYTNTIPPEEEPDYPGDREVERRIKSYIRWNAMAMVVNANRKHDGLGGHISTFASSATLYEVGYNHIFRATTPERCGDLIYFQGHATPGNYSAPSWKDVWITITCTLFVRNWLKAGGFPRIRIPI